MVVSRAGWRVALIGVIGVLLVASLAVALVVNRTPTSPPPRASSAPPALGAEPSAAAPSSPISPPQLAEPAPPTQPGVPGALGLGSEPASPLGVPQLNPTPPPAGRQGLRFGSYTAGMDADPGLLATTASRLGVPMSVASVFRGRGDTGPNRWPYPADVQLGRGRVLLVAWSLQEFGPYSWWASGVGMGCCASKPSACRPSPARWRSVRGRR